MTDFISDNNILYQDNYVSIIEILPQLDEISFRNILEYMKLGYGINKLSKLNKNWNYKLNTEYQMLYLLKSDINESIILNNIINVFMKMEDKLEIYEIFYRVLLSFKKYVLFTNYWEDLIVKGYIYEHPLLFQFVYSHNILLMSDSMKEYLFEKVLYWDLVESFKVIIDCKILEDKLLNFFHKALNTKKILSFVLEMNCAYELILSYSSDINILSDCISKCAKSSLDNLKKIITIVSKKWTIELSKKVTFNILELYLQELIEYNIIEYMQNYTICNSLGEAISLFHIKNNESFIFNVAVNRLNINLLKIIQNCDNFDPNSTHCLQIVLKTKSDKIDYTEEMRLEFIKELLKDERIDITLGGKNSPLSIAKEKQYSIDFINYLEEECKEKKRMKRRKMKR